MTEHSTETDNPPVLRKIGRLRLVSAAAAGVLIVLAGVYGIERLRSNPADAACQPAVNIAQDCPARSRRGGGAGGGANAVPCARSDVQGRDRRAKTLANWRGRTVLLNLWATWCVPCRREMPALDALQAKLGGPDFQVVAVNIDTRDPQKPLAFLKEVGVDPPRLLFRPERARFRGSESRRQSLRHADHTDRRPQAARSATWQAPRNGRATTA